MNRTFASVAGGAFFAGLAAVFAATPAAANVVEYQLNVFEDSNDFVTITTDSPQYAALGGVIFAGPESGGPISFSLDAAIPLAQTGTFLEGLIEGTNPDPGEQAGSLSDALLIFETDGSATVRFLFASDPFDPAITQGAADFSQPEFVNANYMTVIRGGTGFNLIQPIITSETPEPATLALLGVALLSLVGLGIMRRRSGA